MALQKYLAAPFFYFYMKRPTIVALSCGYGYMDKIIFLIFFISLSFLGFQRNTIWKNEYTIWKDVTFKSPGRGTPHINMGNAYIRRGVLDRAEKEFLLAREINELDARAHSGLGAVYFQKGLLDEAIKIYQFITTGKPDFAPGHNNLGVVYMEKGLLDEAIKEFKITMRLDPYFPDAYSNLGFAYKKKGLLKEAMENLEQALTLSPEHSNARIRMDEVRRLLEGKIIK